MKRKTIGRRRDERRETTANAMVTLPGRSGISDAPAIMVDLSNVGMRLHMWSAPPKHRLAQIRVDVEGEIYSVAGRVVRVESAAEGGFMVGIEFDPESLLENPFPAVALVEEPDVIGPVRPER
ncbi:MAG TPA: PilZ domain-containing protein [Planctomycetota bacterium]|nr:PilZ domain-containing protein [Planctomycetota bacterium]